MSHVLRHSWWHPAQTVDKSILEQLYAPCVFPGLIVHDSGTRSSRSAPSAARLRLAVKSCAPLRSAQWFPTEWPRCTRARRIVGGQRGARDCATRDAAAHTTSRLGAPARRPVRPTRSQIPGSDVSVVGTAAKKCALPRAPGALPRPVHRTISTPTPPTDPGAPPHRPTAGQRAGWRRGGG
jgi:hypothetical protein